MSVGWLKATTALILLGTSLVGGWTARRLCASKQCSRILSFGNALAGGFFLGAAFLHLLPEAAESLEGFGGDFPWVMVFALLGFLLILFLEKLVIRDHDHGDEGALFHSRRPVYPYVLTVVLSLHSIIAGYALGAGGSLETVLVIFAAEGAHKFSAAFALGVSLIRAEVPKRRMQGILWLFALMTPIGIALGEFVSSGIEGATAETVSGIVNAVAAGTFVYVAIVDILHEEFESSRDVWPKFGLVILGLGLMGLLAIWA